MARLYGVVFLGDVSFLGDAPLARLYGVVVWEMYRFGGDAPLARLYGVVVWEMYRFGGDAPQARLYNDMMKTQNKTLYRNTYRVETTRANWHDYNCGVFFITICTSQHIHYFGEISDENPVLLLTPLGEETVKIIKAMESKRAGLHIPVFQVMPNHIHLILDTRACERPSNPTPYNTIVSVTISQLKGMVTKYARQHGISFAWQERYWDHIIRDKGYNEIYTYITHNVETWHLDSLNV